MNGKTSNSFGVGGLIFVLLLVALLAMFTNPLTAISQSCPQGSFHPEIDENETWMFDAINQYRLSNGLSSLSWDTRLNSAADWFAGSSYTGSHTDSLGNNINARVACFGYGTWSTEVLSNRSDGTHDSADTSLAWWKNSSAHNAQLLRNDVQKIGIGHAQWPPNAPYQWVWIVDLAPSDQTQPGIQVGDGSSRQQLFLDAYNRNGGAANLGTPTNGATGWTGWWCRISVA